MDGCSGAFGAVGAVRGVRNAIQIATCLAKEQMLGSSLLGRIPPMHCNSSGISMHLKHAEEACSLHLSLTGVLGFRTVHQVDARAQLVLIASTNEQATDDASRIEPCQTQNEAPAFEDKGSYISHGEYNSCEVLRTPRLLQSEIAGGINGNTTESISNHSLTAIQQAVVLAQCLPLGRSSRDDELSSMDAQHQSYPSVENIGKALPTIDAPIDDKIGFSFQLYDLKQQSFIERQEILEAPSLPALPRSNPQPPEFQEFHLRTMERAIRHAETSSAVSSLDASFQALLSFEF